MALRESEIQQLNEPKDFVPQYALILKLILKHTAEVDFGGLISLMRYTIATGLDQGVPKGFEQKPKK